MRISPVFVVASAAEHADPDHLVETSPLASCCDDVISYCVPLQPMHWQEVTWVQIVPTAPWYCEEGRRIHEELLARRKYLLDAVVVGLVHPTLLTKTRIQCVQCVASPLLRLHFVDLSVHEET